MNRRWRPWAVAIIIAATLTVPALGAGVELDGNGLSGQEGWVSQGTSYITLRAYAAATGCALTWENGRACLAGEGLELEARPGSLYLTVNDRALYVPNGVAVTDGKLTVPLRVLAQATGSALGWCSETATAQMITGISEPPRAAYHAEDLYWLSRIISAESGGEPLLGQIAVGNVVLNRVESGQFPDTIKEVIFDAQHGVQFTPTAIGTIYNEPVPSAVLAAKMCLEGAQVVGDCMYFYAPALSAGRWIVNNYTYYTTIGSHRFFR